MSEDLPTVPTSSLVLLGFALATPVIYAVLWVLSRSIRSLDMPEILVLPPVLCIAAAWRTQFGIWMKMLLAVVFTVASFLIWAVVSLFMVYASGGY
ncbi:MAG TPA: hypothetical protein VK956_00055 [Verrucomicrobium sp.]|nr:hypothetical protein [Verrucomicrobium sp.]